jgi:hypothetical protein
VVSDGVEAEGTTASGASDFGQPAIRTTPRAAAISNPINHLAATIVGQPFPVNR